MNELSKQFCEPSRPDAPQVTPEEIAQYTRSIPSWKLVDEVGVTKLKRVFSFKEYKDTLVLVNAIANLAEDENHHPDMLFEYRKLTVYWWSHEMNGLHKNDFICAAKCDLIFESMEKK